MIKSQAKPNQPQAILRFQMKYLFVSLNYAPEQTGIGKFQSEMAAWFAAQGHQVRAICAPPYYPEWTVKKPYQSYRYKTEQIDGVKVYRAPLFVPQKPTGFKRLVHLVSFTKTSFPLILWQAIKWKPDVIVLTEPPLMVAPSVLLAGWVSGAKTHLHIQDFEVDAAFNLGLLKNRLAYKIACAIERFLLRSFSTTSTISPRMIDKLFLKGVDRNRVFLIPNWADIERFDKPCGPDLWRKKLGIGLEDILVLYSGNLGRKQGLEVIVHAARRLVDDPKIRFVISGDGAAREDLVFQAAGLENIIFLPIQPLEAFIPLMKAADIHLVPQRAEAADLVMPSKLGNILGSGRPCVVEAHAGTQIFDAVQGCGLVVPPNALEDFADAISTLANDDALRRELGSKSRERARDQWGKDAALRKLEAAHKQCAPT